MDCAIKAADPVPAVVMTVPALPPSVMSIDPAPSVAVEPVLPSWIVEVPLMPFGAEDTPAMTDPTMPPPPPMDCAITPEDSRELVFRVTSSATVSMIWPPLPLPAPPKARLLAKLMLPAVAPFREFTKPPPPPMDCATTAAD